MRPLDPELLRKFGETFEPANKRIVYALPDQPFPITLKETSGIIPEEDLDLLLSCVRWEIPPPFVSPGRSGWVERKTAHTHMTAEVVVLTN